MAETTDVRFKDSFFQNNWTHYQNCQMAETTAVRFKEYNFVFIFSKQLNSLSKLSDGWDHCYTIQRMQLRFHFPKIVELITKIVRWLRSLLYDSKNATVFIFPSRGVTVSNYYLRDKFSESKHWRIFVEHKYQLFNRVFLNTGQLVLFSGFWQF